MQCPKCNEEIPRNLELSTSSDGTEETPPSYAVMKCLSCGYQTEFSPRDMPKEDIDILNGLPKTLCEEWKISISNIRADMRENKLGARFNQLVQSGKYGQVEALIRIMAEEQHNPLDPFSLFMT